MIRRTYWQFSPSTANKIFRASSVEAAWMAHAITVDESDSSYIIFLWSELWQNKRWGLERELQFWKISWRAKMELSWLRTTGNSGVPKVWWRHVAFEAGVASVVAYPRFKEANLVTMRCTSEKSTAIVSIWTKFTPWHRWKYMTILARAAGRRTLAADESRANADYYKVSNVGLAGVYLETEAGKVRS